MRIAVFSLGPIFPEHVHGGAQKILASIISGMASRGHEVTALCTRRDDNSTPFELVKGAWVRPVLPFKQNFPETHWTAPYNLARVVQILAEAMQSHDRLYINDASLLYHFVYEQTPTVTALHDFVYPEPLIGSLSFRRDRLILNSEYLRDCVGQVFAKFRPLPESSTAVVPNGFDQSEFSRRDPARLLAELGLPPDTLAVLYPHRPDPRKGIWESIEITLAAVERLPARMRPRVRLLVPVWVDSNLDIESDHDYQSLYSRIRRVVAEAGHPDLVFFHPWLAPSRMAEYYSAGRITLCVGNFIESFGCISVESELCGTPAVVSRVGAQRTVLPSELIQKVDYGDVKAATDLVVAALLGEKLFAAEELRSHVGEHYSMDAMIRGYVDTVQDASLTPPLAALELEPRRVDAVRVPAWCARTGSGYYNDYRYGYVGDPRLAQVADRCAAGVIGADEIADLVGAQELRNWVDAGDLVAVPGRGGPRP